MANDAFLRFAELFPNYATKTHAIKSEPRCQNAIWIELKNGEKLFFNVDNGCESGFTLTGDYEVINRLMFPKFYGDILKGEYNED